MCYAKIGTRRGGRGVSHQRWWCGSPGLRGEADSRRWWASMRNSAPHDAPKCSQLSRLRPVLPVEAPRSQLNPRRRRNRRWQVEASTAFSAAMAAVSQWHRVPYSRFSLCAVLVLEGHGRQSAYMHVGASVRWKGIRRTNSRNRGELQAESLLLVRWRLWRKGPMCRRQCFPGLGWCRRQNVGPARVGFGPSRGKLLSLFFYFFFQIQDYNSNLNSVWT
jgi:hypothetical protein